MRLLHVVPTYIPAYQHGGPVFAVHGLCKALAARGHRISVFTTDVDGRGSLDVRLGTPLDLDGIEVTYFPVRSFRRLYLARGMKAALRATTPTIDLMHLHSVFLWPTNTAARLAERARVPYLVAPRGMLVPELLRGRGRFRKAAWLRLLERRTLASASALHFTSELERQDAVRAGIHFRRAVIVPNGVESIKPPLPAEVSHATRAALLGGPMILFLGRLSWKKGLDRLVSSLPMVPHAHLVIAGPDEENLREGLELLARHRGCADRLTVLGEVHGPDKSALLSNCDVLALPSVSENFGNSVLEAMAAGKPVLVTRGVGLAAEVERASAGLVVDEAPEALAQGFAMLLGDPARARDMGRRGSRLVADRYTWEGVAAAMESAYFEILEQHGRSA